ncbi:hypothetical protein LZC95_51870 [Pendulispora brunnea]|uniref:DUF1554 domain-containing protein n=1 Tax=Pendulispora brunnea TaxID=2905690 RepID=A0ABZ2KCV0_9BACT
MKHTYLAFLLVGLTACDAMFDFGKSNSDDDSNGDSRRPGSGDGSSSGAADAAVRAPNEGPASGDNGAFTDAAAGPPNAKRMFVTSAEYPGDFAKYGTGSDPGAAGADKLCSTAAASANLGGTWRAWISSTTNDSDPVVHHAIDRIADVAGGWYNVDRTAWLFKNKANLATVPNESAWKPSLGTASLVEDENGRRAPDGTKVWTGTGTGGQIVSDRTCWRWTVSTANTEAAGGMAAGSADRWTSGVSIACTTPAHFYCFEQ